MGCANTRNHAEERTIEAESVKTGFENHSAAAIANIIRTHSTAKFILSAHFSAIKRELRLNAKPEDQELLNALYARLSSTESGDRACVLAAYPRITEAELVKETLIREEELTVLAVLLSCSSPKDKAVALFRAFDDGLGGTLTESTVNELFRVAFKEALDDLPLLQRHVGDDVKKHLEKAQLNRSKGLAAAVSAAFAGKKTAAVTVKDFSDAVANHLEGQLTTAGGLRSFAVDQSVPEAKPTETAKPTTAETSKAAEQPAEGKLAPASEVKQA